MAHSTRRRTPAPAEARLAHLGLAGRRLDDLPPFFRDVLGLTEAPLDDADGARIAGLTAGDALVELLEPNDPGSPIAKFLEKRGPGLPHVCFQVDDLHAPLPRCRDAGVVLADETPRKGAEGKRIAFLHPKSTGGVLIELTER